MQLSSYLFFNGQCEAAFKFYEQCLGGKIEGMKTHAETPAEANVPAKWRDKILHACMIVGESVLMGSDAPPDHFKQPQGFSVSIQLNDTVKGERTFKELAEGGTVLMPFQQTFWAAGFGMCVDQFGIPRMVNCERGA